MSMAIFSKKNKNIFMHNDPKTLHKNLEFTATEQYKILRANLSFTIPEDVKCPIIGVTSSVRGEGKSTTAVNLSHVLAENGKKVLLIDGDLRIPSIAKKMMIESTPGLTNLLMRFEPRQLISFQSNILAFFLTLCNCCRIDFQNLQKICTSRLCYGGQRGKDMIYFMVICYVFETEDP